MSEFIEREASDDDDELEDFTDGAMILKREIGEGDLNDEDSSEEERQGVNVNEVEEEASTSEVEGSPKETRKRKSKGEESSDEDRLEDDDYDLLEENTGIRFKKKFRRVKVLRDDDSEEEEINERANAKDQIADELFDLDDEPLQGVSQTSTKHRHPSTSKSNYSSEESSEDEIDDFIVDDTGEPIRHRRRTRTTGELDVNEERLQVAQDMFGVDFEVEDLDLDDDDSEDEEMAENRARKTKNKKLVTYQEIYEPAVLERLHYTTQDAEIRSSDIPERIQRRKLENQVLSDDDYKIEAGWIYDELQKIKNKQGNVDENDNFENTQRLPSRGDQEAGCLKIIKILKLMKVGYLEVPFIARYQKDTYKPELTEEDLWNINNLDAKYNKLCKCRNTLYKLVVNTKEFIENPENKTIIESTIGKSIRILTEDDTDSVISIKSFEEVNDFRTFYTLHYRKLTPILKAHIQKSSKEIKEKCPNGENDLMIDLESDQKKLIEENPDSNVQSVPTAPSLKVVFATKYENNLKLLADFLPYYGLTAAHFAQNVSEEYFKTVPTTCNLDILIAANPFTSMQLLTRENVIECANYVLATQISREPELRKTFRAHIFEKGAFSVSPTEIGKKTIDELHSLYTMKYLRDKPIKEFEKDDFLKLVNGEQDKLIVIRFSDEYRDSLISDKGLIERWSAWFQEDGFNGLIGGWNSVRKSVVEQTIFEFLLPVFLKEVKTKLEIDAKDFVVRACRQKIRKSISVGKYKFSMLEDEEDEDEEKEIPEGWSTENGVRVMAIAYEADPTFAPFACILSPDGSDLVDFIPLNHIIFFHKATDNDLELQGKTLKVLKGFIEKNKPHVIVIGGESLEADTLVHLVKEVISELHIPPPEDEEEYEESENFPLISVELINNEVAKVYSMSKNAMAEFGEHPIILRQAISLARKIIDPLIEFGQLYNQDEDILCMSLHPFQGKISKEELLENIEEEFVIWTNRIGLDFNECLTDPRKGHMLQFIGGLGPTKASFLLRLFKRKPYRLVNREQLKSIGHLGPITFANCAGFIRINVMELENGTDDGFIEYLDCTRIHPSHYAQARFIAHQAFYDEDKSDELDEDEMMIQDEFVKKALDDRVSARPKLIELDLQKFAEHLKESQSLPWMFLTLEDIVQEYWDIFADPRKPFESPSSEEIFCFLTKETPQTLCNGKLIHAIVSGFCATSCKFSEDPRDPVKVCENDNTNWACPFCNKEGFPDYNAVFDHYDTPKGVFVSLDNGLSGYIPADKLSDNPNINANTRVRVGQAIVCRVVDLHIGSRKMELTSRGSDLRDEELKPVKDHRYNFEKAKEDELKLQNAQSNKPETALYHRRAIAHTCFQNITYSDCFARLDTMEIGDAIFRPSSKGKDRLTLSWKVMDRVMQHVDIIEKDKPTTDQIGGTLTIDGEDYEDLDEILTRFVYPMASNVKDIINHKHFIKTEGNKEEAEFVLKKKLLENSNQLHYVFSNIKNRPGRFLLSYLLNTSASKVKFAHENVTVTTYGFQYRGSGYESVPQLLRYFKYHYRDPPSTGTPMIGSASTSGSVNLF